MKKSILILFAVICFFTLILFIIFNTAVYPHKYKNYVVKYSNDFGLDSSLVYAIIKTESNFNLNAKSSAGAMGLMQLIKPTAEWIAGELGEQYEERNMYIAETNIKYGCFYLNYLFKKFSDMGAVICAYNAGENVVKNWLNEDGTINVNKITFSETKNYYIKVLSYYNVYTSNQKGI